MKAVAGAISPETVKNVQNLVSKALFSRDILTHNIAIKRYFRGIDFYWPRLALNKPHIKVLYFSLRAYLG